MTLGRLSPGDCPVCGAAHTACTAGDRQKSITTVQLPARDAAAAVVEQVPLVADVALPALGDGTDGKPFSAATYRRKKAR